MPSAQSHLIFAEDFLAAWSVAASAAEGVIPEGRSVPSQSRASSPTGGHFHLPSLVAGAQGPDPFFFYGKSGGRHPEDGQRISATADYLHSCDPAESFGPLCSALTAGPGGAEHTRRRSFLTGLLLHYILDRKMHPYVFYRSGFDEDGKLGPKTSVAHARFEAVLALALHVLLRPGTRPPGPKALLGTASGAEIAETLGSADALLAAAFPNRCHPGDYQRSWRDMVAILSLLQDRWGIKAAVLDALGAGSSQARAMIIPFRQPKSPPFPWPDLLNLNAAPWRRPDSGLETRETVPELYKDALRDALRGAAMLLDQVDGAGTAEDGAWIDFLGSINHGGIPFGSVLRYSALR